MQASKQGSLMGSSSSSMSLKLLVDKKRHRVVFAEATKDFVDFLLHIFSLPMGAVVEFLGSKQMVGCLGKLKESVQSLNQTYLQPGVDKAYIVNPKTTFHGGVNLLLPHHAWPDDLQSATPKTQYRCDYGNARGCRNYVTQYAGAKCPPCNTAMSRAMISVVPEDAVAEAEEAAAAKRRDEKGGYVKEVVTYMVMDDLVVKPMSTISSIGLINKFDVKDVSQLEEMVVSFGKVEASKLLKASLMTDKVLTSVFLPKKI